MMTPPAHPEECSGFVWTQLSRYTSGGGGFSPSSTPLPKLVTSSQMLCHRYVDQIFFALPPTRLPTYYPSAEGPLVVVVIRCLSCVR